MRDCGLHDPVSNPIYLSSSIIYDLAKASALCIHPPPVAAYAVVWSYGLCNLTSYCISPHPFKFQKF